MTGDVYRYLLDGMGEYAYQQKPYTSANCFVGMYHSKTLEKHKKRVLNSLLEGEKEF